MTASVGKTVWSTVRMAAGALLVAAVAACGGSRNERGTDISVSASAVQTSPQETGSTVAFTMTVRNVGVNTAEDVRITDSLGNFLTAPVITCEASGGATCPDAPSFLMTIPSIPTGGVLVFTVTATANATANVSVANTLSATVNDDVNRNDNNATATIDITATNSDLVVAGTGPAATVAGGGSAEFVMTVTNAGADAASNVRITEQVGSNLSLTGITCSASNGAVCPATGVVMTLDTLPAGGVLEFRVQATVQPGTSGSIVNTLAASADNDRNRDNNSFVATGSAYSPRSGVFASGSGPAAPVASGSSATFTMAVGNAGPDTAVNVRVIDTIGGNLTLTGVTCSRSDGQPCPAVGPSFTVDSLPPGVTVNLAVTGFVALGTNGSITNTIQVTSDTNDPDRGDNTAVAVGSAYADNVAVSASGPGSAVSGGSSTTLTAVVTNTGPGTALDVDITNTLGANLSLAGNITCVAAGGAVCPATTGATVRSPAIPINGTLTFSIPVTVAAGANGTLVDTVTASAAGDTRAADNSASATLAAVSADLGISEDVASPTVAAGSSAVFRVLVANPGPGSADNLAIHWSPSAPFTVSGETVTCSASGGATCPATLGRDIAVPTLGPQRSLLFTYTVPVPESGRGALTATATVSADGDPNTANNTAVATTTAVDARNGLYRAYAADGRVYDMTLDLDARQYTMAGNGTSATFAFSADGAGNYVVGGNQKFRLAQDLVVGGHAFSAGVVPYVAARSFATSVSSAVGQYNLMTLEVNPDGTAPTTQAGTARVTGNVLQVCRDDFVVVQTAACDVGALKSYTLTVSGDVYTGVDTATGLVALTFRVARSGAASMILAAGPSIVNAARLQFQIGLAESAGLIGGTVFGPGFNGYLTPPTSDFVTILLTRTTYSVAGTPPFGADAGLFRAQSDSPVALLQGNPDRSLAGGTIWVMQAYPLVVAFGDALTSTAAPTNLSGLLQIGVP